MWKIISVVYGAIGLIIAIIDAISGFKLFFLATTGVSCALAENLMCVTNSIEKILLFGVDVIVGPFLVLAWVLNNIWLVLIFIIIVAIGVYYFFN